MRSSRSPRPVRRRLLVLLVGAGGAIVVLIVALVVLSSMTASSFVAGISAAVPFPPTEADGMIPDAERLTPADDGRPAVGRLDAELLEALRAAAEVADDDGISFDITSGWRSEAYQRWLLQEAIRTYGSEEVAREFVATPEQSSHVTGHAVDIGSLDAQLWIIEHGREWGLCQTYANERWHFERATTDGGECPPPLADARG
ncbi:M15 family metallopeptidase [Microbacterium sp. NPDC007973]|uniref:M15 family metallopeptidase n=1 Tax=Microbacterium sp. NPDC007973 TaxID=3364182 RepID=UPI0036EA7293